MLELKSRMVESASEISMVDVQLICAEPDLFTLLFGRMRLFTHVKLCIFGCRIIHRKHWQSKWYSLRFSGEFSL